MSYFQKLTEAKEKVVEELNERGIKTDYLKFGGPGDAPNRKPTVPTDARSEFLANRAMGDWAENILCDAIRATRNDWQVTHYGNADSMAAGEAGFKAFYLAGLEEVRLYGKRPDLLLFPKSAKMPDSISAEPFTKVDPLVSKAIGALEVRSSKFEAQKYMRVRAHEKQSGKKSGREVPSFTVKVEDLKIVFRWIERYRRPQAYAQVFFDSVYVINVLQIFDTIGSGKGFVIEKPAKSQEKATIMIPITSGTCVGRFEAMPRFEAVEKITRLGRHDAYVVPVGGQLTVDCRLLETVLAGEAASSDASLTRASSCK